MDKATADTSASPGGDVDVLFDDRELRARRTERGCDAPPAEAAGPSS